MTYRKRVLTALVAGAVALPFLGSPALAGDTPIPTPRDISTFCANPTAPQFTDVQSTDVFALAIRCIATAGITQGNPGTPQQPQGIGEDKYGPLLDVTRGQMASFIARMIDASVAREVNEAAIKELPAPGAANPFPGDVPNNYVHLNNIKRLTQAGIVQGNPGTAQQPQGIGADRYGPDLPVTRSQMASFLNRAVAYMTGGNPSAAGTSGNGLVAPAGAHYYVDEQQQTHVANVNAVTAARIANGVGGQRYNGLGNVTRAQMAGFIARTLATLFSSQDSGVAAKRIVGLLEVFSANFSDENRSTATRLAGGAGDAPATSERTFTASGLASGVEYRITLVKAGQVTRAAETNEVRFATGTAAGSFFLVNTGTPTADIVSVNNAAPVNNTQAGAATTPNDPNASRTAVATAVNGTITFTIEGEDAEDVIAVIYVNGGGTQASYATGGGAHPALEVDAQGRPVERFGLTGVTRFLAP